MEADEGVEEDGESYTQHIMIMSFVKHLVRNVNVDFFRRIKGIKKGYQAPR
jgi:hypothetical protein